MSRPTLRQLEYLIAVVELRHFGKAAEHCFVTQSTLSAGLRELESQLGVELVERTRRSVMPTALGETVARRARQLLQLADELTALARSDGTPLAGPLRLGVIPTIGPYLLPRVLPEVRRRHPRLELYLTEDQTDHLLAAVTDGRLDVAIVAFPYETGALERAVVLRESFRVAVPDGHPLATRDAIHAHEIPPDRLLLLEDGHCLTDHAVAACGLEGLRASAAFKGTSLYTLLQMVAGGQGFTFVPEMAQGPMLPGISGIELVPLAEAGPHREIGLVWRPSYFRGDDLRLLAQEMETLLAA